MNIIPIKAHLGITGFESPAAEYTTLPLTLDDLLITHPSATFLGLAVGDSMTESGIFDGDVLIVDRSVTPTKLDVIVATYNGVFICKLLDRTNKKLLWGKRFGQQVKLNEDDDFLEEGIVISSIRTHRIPDKLLQCMG